VVVNGILRLLVRYLVEIEGIDTSTFTRAQIHCFTSTLDAMKTHLITSLQQLIEQYLVIERMQLTQTAPSVNNNNFITIFILYILLLL
jgi:hypothetical protein